MQFFAPPLVSWPERHGILWKYSHWYPYFHWFCIDRLSIRLLGHAHLFVTLTGVAYNGSSGSSNMLFGRVFLSPRGLLDGIHWRRSWGGLRSTNMRLAWKRTSGFWSRIYWLMQRRSMDCSNLRLNTVRTSTLTGFVISGLWGVLSGRVDCGETFTAKRIGANGERGGWKFGIFAQSITTL